MTLAEALLVLGRHEDGKEMGDAVMVVNAVILGLQRETRGLTKVVYLLTEAAEPDIRDKAHAAYEAEIGVI